MQILRREDKHLKGVGLNAIQSKNWKNQQKNVLKRDSGKNAEYKAKNVLAAADHGRTVKKSHA